MRFILSILITLITLSAVSRPDNKAVKQLKADIISAKANIKAKKDLEKTEQMVRKHLADSAYHDDTSLHMLLCDVLKQAYEVGNEKMYLKQNVDTTCLMKTCQRMFVAYDTLDSLATNKKDKNAQHYVRKMAMYLNPIQQNLYKGGLYFMRKGDNLEAYRCFDVYSVNEKDKKRNDRMADVMAVSMAVRLDSLPLVLKHAERAMNDSVYGEHALAMACTMCRNHYDGENYLRLLNEGYQTFPNSTFFYPRLIDHYIMVGKTAVADSLADDALRRDSLNPVFLYGKQDVLVQMGEYSKSLEYGEKAIALNPNLATPYYNIGYVYYQRAEKAIKKSRKPYRQRLHNAQEQYRLCLPYMEKYRAMRPDDIGRWRPILYDAYLNLNMGKEFVELKNNQ